MRAIALEKLCKALGYVFKNEALLEHALTHRSVEGRANNERLEFLGDAILNAVTAIALFKKFPDCAEGELTRLRASLVKGDTLAKIALEMDLGNVMNLGLGELNTGGFRRHSTIEDALEAVIGAIYLDSDFVTVQTLLAQWFQSRLNALDISDIPSDYKSRLQEYLQSKGLSLPQYEVLRQEGPDHAKIFWIVCKVVDLNITEEAEGHSKKIAEQQAAYKVLLKIPGYEFKTTSHH
jgi:ribonuclease-3